MRSGSTSLAIGFTMSKPLRVVIVLRLNIAITQLNIAAVMVMIYYLWRHF
jgi:hypothetical protein